ncbi:hypothetical protein PFISCL1PPCAC_26915, partial [Pristionchus fissidentatus]
MQVATTYFTSLQNRLAVMEYLNHNDTATIVGLESLNRLSEDFISEIQNNLRKTSWLSDTDSFGLNILDQFELYLDKMQLITDFDKFDTNLTQIRTFNRHFTAHYYESVKRDTGCQWLNVAIALESGRLMLARVANTEELYSLLLRVQNSFDFNTFTYNNNVILLAPTFFPLSQNTSEPAFV